MWGIASLTILLGPLIHIVVRVQSMSQLNVKHIIRNRFDEISPPAYEYPYLHAHTRTKQIRPYSSHIEDT